MKHSPVQSSVNFNHLCSPFWAKHIQHWNEAAFWMFITCLANQFTIPDFPAWPCCSLQRYWDPWSQEVANPFVLLFLRHSCSSLLLFACLGSPWAQGLIYCPRCSLWHFSSGNLYPEWGPPTAQSLPVWSCCFSWITDKGSILLVCGRESFYNFLQHKKSFYNLNFSMTGLWTNISHDSAGSHLRVLIFPCIYKRDNF